MKLYDEEVAYNLLWIKPGVKFWYRQTAVGPVVVGEILEVDVKKQLVRCCIKDEAGLEIFTSFFKLGLHEPQHMSTYPGEHFIWPKTD